MTRTLAELPNLGPMMAEKLARVGILDEAELRAIGAPAAFLRLRATGEKVSLIALYALDAALEGRHWLDTGEERKRALRSAAAFDGADL
jgi:DNA transformation protein